MAVISMIKLLFSICACLAAGFIGSFFTMKSIDTWYAVLKKPLFNPPSWVFVPVWTILYILMGIAAFFVWQKKLDNQRVKNALSIFIIQLILNTLWTPAFFGMKSPLAGLIVIVLLWVALFVTILLFYHVSKVASFLLIPYVLWVSYALVINAAVAYLNF